MSRTRPGIVCRERLRVLLPAIACALFTACASGGGYRAEAPELSSNLVVENHSWGPVTVYISASGQPLRVGDVDGVSQRSFSLEKFRSAVEGRDIYFVARPLAGQPFRSEAISFMPGRTTVWTIEDASALSHLMVR